MSNQHLTLEERYVIAHLHLHKVSLREIARQPRHPSALLVLDGVYRSSTGVPLFRELRGPTAAQPQTLLSRIMQRIIKLLTRTGDLPPTAARFRGSDQRVAACASRASASVASIASFSARTRGW